MIINDLNHLEVISEETNVMGMGYKKPTKKYGFASASAGADATAIGRYTFSDTYTNATAVAGVFSSSSSRSFAVAAS